VTVECPGGRYVLSGGWSISVTSGGDDEADITVIHSEATSNTEWTVEGEESTSVGAWSIQAHAVCAAVTP
jgi:hypothetical protein